MESVVRNIFRLFALSVYPSIIAICFYALYRKNKYKESIKKHWKWILCNTLTVLIVGSVFIYIFYSFEDTIYSYDYAGHWIRALKLRELFFNNPSEIFKSIYESMNYNEYSSLPALLGLGFILINDSYGFFVLSIFVGFLGPILLLLNIQYFTYYKKFKWLPIVVSIIFYPLYYSIIYGEVDVVGMLFVVMAYMLIILQDYDEIDTFDNIVMNLFGFMMIFLRRWYLFTLVAIYIVYFIKFLIRFKKDIFKKDTALGFVRIVSSGIILLVVILVFFRPFLGMVLGKSFSEAYSFYNHDGKLISLINFYSWITIMVSIYGIYTLIKERNHNIIVYISVLILIPLIMFWRIQSMEYHHYYMITLNVLILFVVGLYNLLDKTKYINLLVLVMSFQLILIYCPVLNYNLPVFTKLRKHPLVLEYKQDVIDFTYYLKSITPEDWQSAYLASGSSVLNDDMIRNSILPDTDAPQIDSAVLDLRDGFPKDLQYINYVITIDPIQYSDKDYQHIYEIITEAIIRDTIVSKIYKPVNTVTINGLTLTVYERIDDFNKEIKEYFYQKMISYYPDKEEFFKYIME